MEINVSLDAKKLKKGFLMLFLSLCKIKANKSASLRILMCD